MLYNFKVLFFRKTPKKTHYSQRGDNMNCDFPRIITEQRKKLKLSQKQAASDLGISQALLSHYEKGIRECGLDFVVKIADYYNVSCDLLLGRENKNENTDSENKLNSSIASLLSIFQNDNQSEINEYIMLNIYKLLHMLCGENQSFKLPDTISENLTDSVIMNICANIKSKEKAYDINISDSSLQQLIVLSEKKITEFHHL